MAPSIWRQIQKNNFFDLNLLADYLQLSSSHRALLWDKPRFSLNLPQRLAAKIEKNTIVDPIFRQFVPLKEEEREDTHFIADPVHDFQFCKSPKLLQKYEGRALVLTTSACAMHCRFCFRQNFDYSIQPLFEEELAYIRSDSTLKEIILSGGDPLSLGDAQLSTLLGALSEIPHVNVIRFHTRFPVGIPERIDSSFLNVLQQCKKQITFILHANHPKELDSDVLAALKRIQMLGIPVLLQTVLLEGINDNLATLKELFETCISNGVIPYYLHALDQVKGTAHFEVSEEKGLSLIAQLTEMLPGYAIPRFVREIAGQKNKTLLTGDKKCQQLQI